MLNIPFGICRLIFGRCRRRSCLALTAAWCFVIIIINIRSLFKTEQAPDIRTPRVDSTISSTILERHTRLTERSTERLRTTKAPTTVFVPRMSQPATKANLQSTGALNLHSWSVCGFELQSLKQWPLFPEFPDRKSFLSSNFSTRFSESDVGKRLFGYLYPAVTGRYRLAISSDDTSELWLSTNQDPSNVRLIAQVYSKTEVAWTKPGEYNKYPTQMSEEIFLESGRRYFVDCFLKNGVGEGHVSVAWQRPGGGQLDAIPGQVLIPFCDDSEDSYRECLKKFRTLNHVKLAMPTPPEPRLFQHDQQDPRDVLPLVTYDPPSYVGKYNTINLKQMLSLLLSQHTSVYPEDSVKIQPGSHFLSSAREFAPNAVLPQLRVDSVVDHFMSILASKHNKRFSLDKILSVEGKEHKNHGTRFLLDLRLYDKHQKKHSRLTEYVNRDAKGRLSFVEGFTWKRTATIHFIVSVKDQYEWVTHLVEEMTKLYTRTKDEHFRLIIVDFKSTDGDIDSLLKDGPLSEKYTVLKAAGPFNKTLAIKKGVDSINDPGSIVFLFDLQVTVPVTLLESIRKHTIQNITVFTPIVARLDCGFSSLNPKGRWEETDGRLVAVYKSDWQRFSHGVTETLGHTWGGEDWYLLDCMLRAGLEFIRLKIPGLYRFITRKASES